MRPRSPLLLGGLLLGLSSFASLAAQEHEDDPATRRVRLATSIEQHERILELRWRRAANGDLELAPKEPAEAPFAPAEDRTSWSEGAVCHVAGAFDPAAVAEGLAGDPELAVKREGGVTTIAAASATGARVTSDRFTFHTGAPPAAAEPKLAERLLAPGDAAVRLLVREGSDLFSWLAQLGCAGLVEAEVTLALPGEEAVLAAQLRTVDRDVPVVLRTPRRDTSRAEMKKYLLQSLR